VGLNQAALLLLNQGRPVEAEALARQAVSVAEGMPIGYYRNVRGQYLPIAQSRRASRWLSPLSCCQRLNIVLSQLRRHDGVAFWVKRHGSDLITDFFRRQKAGAATPEALASAQAGIRTSRDENLRLSRAHLFFWAPFVHVGE
jgi:hypothetical protein